MSAGVRANRMALRDYFVTAFKVLPGARSTGSALRAVRPPNLHITSDTWVIGGQIAVQASDRLLSSGSAR